MEPISLHTALYRFTEFCEKHIQEAQKRYIEYTSITDNADFNTALCNAENKKINFWESVSLPYCAKHKEEEIKKLTEMIAKRKKTYKEKEIVSPGIVISTVDEEKNLGLKFR